mgnify:FL=1
MSWFDILKSDFVFAPERTSSGFFGNYKGKTDAYVNLGSENLKPFIDGFDKITAQRSLVDGMGKVIDNEKSRKLVAEVNRRTKQMESEIEELIIEMLSNTAIHESTHAAFHSINKDVAVKFFLNMATFCQQKFWQVKNLKGEKPVTTNSLFNDITEMAEGLVADEILARASEKNSGLTNAELKGGLKEKYVPQWLDMFTGRLLLTVNDVLNEFTNVGLSNKETIDELKNQVRSTIPPFISLFHKKLENAISKIPDEQIEVNNPKKPREFKRLKFNKKGSKNRKEFRF